MNLPAHGGDLQWAQAHFGGDASDWLDLSTGISPWSWPVPPLPVGVWQRLPPVDDLALRRAAAQFYGCAADCVLPVPGSQFAVANIPRCLPACTVAVPDPGYHEHARAWQAAGHRIVHYQSPTQLERLIEGGEVQSAVVINPNNPTAQVIKRQKLLHWHALLQQRQGLLLVDEAFAEVQAVPSLAGEMPLPNLIVLRSLGKFFGLAGLRLGFAIASPAWLKHLQRWCSPWQLSHPAHYVGVQALLDQKWQAQQTLRLTGQAAQLQAMLQPLFVGARIANGGLFVTVSACDRPLYPVFLQLAQAQVLLRYGQSRDGDEWLRWGLPGEQFHRLNKCAAQLRAGQPHV